MEASQVKVAWEGEVVSVQPRSTVWRYLLDNRTHRRTFETREHRLIGCNIARSGLPHSRYCLCQVCAKKFPSPYEGSGKEVPWTVFPQLISNI
jgi:hypothetical protein